VAIAITATTATTAPLLHAQANAAPTAASTTAPDARSRSAQVLESWLARMPFSGAVLVARGDELLLHEARGMADARQALPNTPQTRHLLASVSKQFTAAAVLRLVDQGRVHLDEPVRAYLPELPAAWRRVTVRQLLAHTSGIPNHTEGEAFEQTKTRAWTPRELLASFADKPLEFTPGTRFRYSNSGYIVAGILIETVSGLSYAQFVERELLQPLGLSDTGVADGSKAVARLAKGLRPGTDSSEAGFVHMSVPYAAGAFYGSTADLLRWQRALYGGKLLSAQSLREMTKVQQGVYALGLGVRGTADAPLYHHSGSIDGFSTYLLYDSAAGVSVALLANREGLNLERMAAQLADAASGRPVRLPHEVPAVVLDKAQLQALEGTYERPGQPGSFWVVLSGDQLWARQGPEAWRELRPQSSTLFYAPEIDAELRFERATDGRGTSLRPLGGPEGEVGRAWQRVEKPLPSLLNQRLFLRGSVNRWGTADRMRSDGSGRHEIEVRWPAGDHEFKIASEDWSAADFGGSDNQAVLLPQAATSRLAMAFAGRNLVLRLDAPAACRLVLDGRDPVRPTLEWHCRPHP
jgi:CubicO group peptidase (beta-lactamase class C family)